MNHRTDPLPEICESQAHDSSGVAISWIDHIEALELLYSEWQQLAENSTADLYLAPDWFAVWWAHYGGGRRLSCMVARKEGALVGLLPFCIETLKCGPLRFRVARLSGIDRHSIFFNLPLMRDVAAGCLLASFTHLIEHVGCEGIFFSSLSLEAGALEQLSLAASCNPSFTLAEQPDGHHTVFDLPESFELYLASLSSGMRKRIRRNRERLEQRFAARPTTVYPTGSEFAQFAEFHSRQWRAVNKGGHFSDWSGSSPFYEGLAESLSPAGRMRIDGLAGLGAPLDATLSLVSGRVCYARLPARTLDREAARLSVGMVGFVILVQKLIGLGIRRIEDGRGVYEYKSTLGGRIVPVRRVFIRRTAAISFVRLWLLLACSKSLNLLYYEGWFKRIAPRLRRLTKGEPRALWKLWIKTRFSYLGVCSEFHL